MEITPDDIANDRVMDLQGAIAEFRAEFPEDNNILFADNSRFARVSEALSETYGHLGRVVTDVLKNNYDCSALVRNFDNGWPVAHSYNTGQSGFTVITVSTALATACGRPRYQPIYPSLPSTSINTDEEYATVLPDMPKSLRNHEIWQRFCFDHESAHGLTFNRHKYGLRDEMSVEESICDSYALIRHYQREGTQSGLGEYLVHLRTLRSLEQDDFDHWTCKALAKIIAMKDEGFDFNALTPKQSYALAHDMVLDPINEIRADCAKLREAFNEIGTHAATGRPIKAYLDWVVETGVNTGHSVVRDFAENWFDMRLAIKPRTPRDMNDTEFVAYLEHGKRVLSRAETVTDAQPQTQTFILPYRPITPVQRPLR